MQAGQVDIWDNKARTYWVTQHKATTWTFSTNVSGVILGKPFIAQPPAPPVLPRTESRSVSLNFSTINKGQLFFEPYYMSSSYNSAGHVNGTATVTKSQPATFPLYIQGGVPCAHPMTKQTCADNTLQLSTDTWSAFDVDAFLADRTKTRPSVVPRA